MDDKYDVIILGTGITECMLSGLLSVNEKKVLHIDTNDYYGGACASLTLEQCWKHFKMEGKPSEELGNAQQQRRYSIDLLPKFLMATGKMVQLLLHTDVTRYLEFKSVDGSYVLKDRKIMKVPATEKEALGSSLMGFWEKNRFKNFLVFCNDYDVNNPKTHNGVSPKAKCIDCLKKYSLDDSTVDVITHALCLYLDESWIELPASDMIGRVKLYLESLKNYGKSPYLYPIYGLGDLPQGFARLSAIYGGTFMLNKPIDKINYDENGHVVGLTSDGETVELNKGGVIIGDPSYFPEKTMKVGEVVRCICIMDHPIPNTNDSESVQIILPQTQLKRKNDIYISMVSYAHSIAPKGKYICLVSTTVETNDPKRELAPGLAYIGNVIQQFWSVDPLYTPVHDHKTEGVHISNSYDATSHFQTIAEDVLRIYTEITGETNTSHLLVPKPRQENQ